MVLQTATAAGDYRSGRNIPLAHTFEVLAESLSGERGDSHEKHDIRMRRALEYFRGMGPNEDAALFQACGLSRAEVLDYLDFFSPMRTVRPDVRIKAIDAFRRLSTHFYDGWDRELVQ